MWIERSPTDRRGCWREKMRKGAWWNKEMVPLLLLRVSSSALSTEHLPPSHTISSPLLPSFLPATFPQPPWRYVAPPPATLPSFLPPQKADSTTTTGNPRLLKRPRRRVCIPLHATSCTPLTQSQTHRPGSTGVLHRVRRNSECFLFHVARDSRHHIPPLLNMQQSPQSSDADLSAATNSTASPHPVPGESRFMAACPGHLGNFSKS